VITIPISKRYYTRQGNGVISTVRAGTSPFVLVTAEVFEALSLPTTGLVSLNGEMFRVVEVLPPGFASDKVLVMKESPIAQLLSLWYRNIFTRVRRVMQWEKPRLLRAGVKNGDMLPWWSFTRLIATTILRPQGEIILT
jgi:hypothetical protein